MVYLPIVVVVGFSHVLMSAQNNICNSELTPAFFFDLLLSTFYNLHLIDLGMAYVYSNDFESFNLLLVYTK
ncbi:hypothetical protein QVD17_01871 [Tagetes erecta]|uniref:Uncharacterized protein n=1 Tax=Tagetes erecta TaxID=13708 RepID=A0AAD8P8M8_TARER|nr:hypothetical protein QVD17_01871 [Tagetes erecta]